MAHSLIPILGIFFLRKSAHGWPKGIVNLSTEERHKSTIRAIVADVHSILGSYIRAEFILAALTAVALTVVLSLMRVPYSLALSPLAGACEFIPVDSASSGVHYHFWGCPCSPDITI